MPPVGKNIGFNLLDDEYFTIPYIIDTAPNLQDGHQLVTRANKNVRIIAINEEEPITAQSALDELNRHQPPHGKYKVKISLCRRKSYQRKDLEEICSIFYQVIPVVSHIEVHLQDKFLTPKNIIEDIEVTYRQFWKEDLFLQYEKNKNFSLLSSPIPTKSLPDEKCSFIHSLIQVLKKTTVLMHVNLLHATVQMGVLRFKVFILISTTVQ